MRSPAVSDATPVISRTPRAYSSSAARSEAAAAAARRAGSSSSPSSSAASSSSGTSATVHSASRGRASSARSSADSRGAASASSAGFVHRSATSCSGVSGIQHRLTSRRTSGLSRRSASMIASLASRSRPRARASTAASRSRSDVTKVVRARLCGRREARARSRAPVTIAGVNVIRVPATSSVRGPAGTRCRARSAAAITPTIRRSPLRTATASSGSGTASTPGKSCPGVASTALDSPRPGSTWLM